MTIQPADHPHEPAPAGRLLPAPGWYPDPRAAGVQRYWDGGQWTEHVAAGQQQAPQQVVVVGGGRGGHVSGLTTGQHVLHGTLTLLTCGLWGIVWFLKATMGRRAIR